MTTTSADRFLSSVDLPVINPPPNWTGFTIKNLSSQQEGNLSLSGVFSSQFRTDAKQNPNGDLHISNINDKNAVLNFLRYLKEKQPQIEIVFETGPKSPDLIGLACEGIKAVLRKVHPLGS